MFIKKIIKTYNTNKIKNSYNLNDINIEINIKKSEIICGYFYLRFKVEATTKSGNFSYTFDEPVDSIKLAKGYYTLEEIINYKIKETLDKRTSKAVRIKKILVS